MNNTSSHGDICYETVPSAGIYLSHLEIHDTVILFVALFLTLITVLIYVIHASKVIRKMSFLHRRHLVLKILGIYPIFSITSLLILFVPRSRIIIHVLSLTYYGYALCKFTELIPSSCFGIRSFMLLHGGSNVDLATPPFCCCCFCLPVIKLNLRHFYFMAACVVQASVVKSIIAILTALLWADGIFQVHASKIQIVFSIANLVSSLFAVYGLNLLLNCTKQPLKEFKLKRKFLTMQLVLITTTLGELIIKITVYVVSTNCFMPPLNDYGERIIQCFIILIMVPLSLLSLRVFLTDADFKADSFVRYFRQIELTIECAEKKSEEIQAIKELLEVRKCISQTKKDDIKDCSLSLDIEVPDIKDDSTPNISLIGMFESF